MQFLGDLIWERRELLVGVDWGRRRLVRPSSPRGSRPGSMSAWGEPHRASRLGHTPVGGAPWPVGGDLPGQHGQGVLPQVALGASEGEPAGAGVGDR
jgi:hypothetical protein